MPVIVYLSPIKINNLHQLKNWIHEFTNACECQRASQMCFKLLVISMVYLKYIVFSHKFNYSNLLAVDVTIYCKQCIRVFLSLLLLLHQMVNDSVQHANDGGAVERCCTTIYFLTLKCYTFHLCLKCEMSVCSICTQMRTHCTNISYAASAVVADANP